MLMCDILVRMSRQSEAVKKWRRDTKQRIVNAFGGSCAICAYKKCLASLALHHLDPAEKDFSFGRIRANPRSWFRMVKELRKCVLLCHNCHDEVHAGVSVVPANAPRFNEEYADYQKVLAEAKREAKVKLFTPCLQCGEDKPNQNKYCSSVCSGKAAYRVDWDSIDLLKELETKSKIQVADELGISDSAVGKRLRKILGS